MKEPEIRPVEVADQLWIDQLWRSWLLEEPLPEHLDSAEELQKQHWRLQSVLEGSLPGVALAAPGAGILLWVGIQSDLHGLGIYVSPPHRRRGLGTSLLREGLRQAKLLRFPRVLLSPYVSNPRALTWLQREGFRPFQVVLAREI